MNRRVTIVAVTAGLLASIPTAAWADQKPGDSVVSYKKLASFFSRGNNGNGWGWGRGDHDDDRPGRGDHGNGHGNGHDHDGDNGHHWGGDKSRGC